MQTFITILITLAVWQLLIWIYYLITNNEDKTITMACFLWVPLALFLQFAYAKIQLIKSRKYNLYQLYGKEGRWIGDFYLTPKTAELFKQTNIPNQEYTIRLLKEGKNFKSPIEKRMVLFVKDHTVISPLGYTYLDKFLK
jgi:hypothetical protein